MYPPSSGGYGKGGPIPTGGGYLCLPPSEHSHILHHEQAHYGPVSGGIEMPSYKGFQALVRVVGPGIVGDAYIGSGVRTGGYGGGGGRA